MNEPKSQVYAKLSSSHTSAKKVRIIMELIRNKDAVLAERILAFHPSKGCLIDRRLSNRQGIRLSARVP